MDMPGLASLSVADAISPHNSFLYNCPNDEMNAETTQVVPSRSIILCSGITLVCEEWHTGGEEEIFIWAGTVTLAEQWPKIEWRFFQISIATVTCRNLNDTTHVLVFE